MPLLDLGGYTYGGRHIKQTAIIQLENEIWNLYYRVSE
jgi:hypothetical protein